MLNREGVNIVTEEEKATRMVFIEELERIGLTDEEICAALDCKYIREEERIYYETMLENCSGDMI